MEWGFHVGTVSVPLTGPWEGPLSATAHHGQVLWVLKKQLENFGQCYFVDNR